MKLSAPSQGLGSSGAVAPDSASYLTLGTNTTLTSERVLTAGTGISLTDNGAGSTLVIASSAAAGTDSTAWHKTGDSYATDTILGNTHAGPNKLEIYNNNAKWGEFSESSAGGINTPRKSILLGNEFTPITTDGGSLQYKRTDTWACMNLVCTQDGSAGQGTGEALIGLNNNNNSAQLVFNAIGSAFAGTTYGVNTASQTRIRAFGPNFVVGTMDSGSQMLLMTEGVPAVKIDSTQYLRTTGPLFIGGFSDGTPNIGNEFLRVKGGHISCDGYLGVGSVFSADPTNLIVARKSGATTYGVIVDNQDAAGSTMLRIGNDPENTNKSCTLLYTNSDDNTYLSVGTGFLKLRHGTSARMTIDGTGLSFWGAATVSQRAAVADAAGGAVVDAEARTAINTLLSRMRDYALIAT